MTESKHQGLTARIPRDVVERARKAGANEVDWYAGRLEDSAAGRSSSSRQTLKSNHERVLATHKQQRSERRHEQVRSPLMLIASLWQRVKGHVPRIAG